MVTPGGNSIYQNIFHALTNISLSRIIIKWNEKTNWVKAIDCFFPLLSVSRPESPATVFVLCNWEMIMRALVPSSNYHSAPLHHHQLFTSDIIIIIVSSSDCFIDWQYLRLEIFHKREISIRILARPGVSITRLISPRLGRLSLVLFYQRCWCWWWWWWCCEVMVSAWQGETTARHQQQLGYSFKYQLIGKGGGVKDLWNLLFKESKVVIFH